MISYSKFKELFDTLDSNRDPEIEFYFKNKEKSYLLIKFNNYLSYGEIDSKGEKFYSIDELYEKN